MLDDGRLKVGDVRIVAEWMGEQGDIDSLSALMARIGNTSEVAKLREMAANSFVENHAEELAGNDSDMAKKWETIRGWMPNRNWDVEILSALYLSNPQSAAQYRMRIKEPALGMYDTLSFRAKISSTGVASVLTNFKAAPLDIQSHRSLSAAIFGFDTSYSTDAVTSILSELQSDSPPLSMDLAGGAARYAPQQALVWASGLKPEQRGPALNQVYFNWTRYDADGALQALRSSQIPMTPSEQINILLGIKSADGGLAEECHELISELEQTMARK